MKSKKIILAGSGHAHLKVIKSLSARETAENEFILVSPFRQTYYSGLIPRLIIGDIDENSLTIDSAGFAESHGVKYVQSYVRSIDEKNNLVVLENGENLNYDLLSLNVGGVAENIPTEAPFNTVYLRPLDQFIPMWREIQRVCSACVNPSFIVVGGGAAAVEVTTALRIRLNKNQARNSEVHLIAGSQRLCKNYAETTSSAIYQALLKNNIQVHLGETVNQIYSKYVKLSDGKRLEFDKIFIATPTLPSNIISANADNTLRISSNIFAVGDGALIQSQPLLPRSGVIAVHQGRHLVKSIRDVLDGKNPTAFMAPKKQLNILISGEKTARLVWGSFSFDGKLPRLLKNLIDEHYVKQFKRSDTTSLT